MILITISLWLCLDLLNLIINFFLFNKIGWALVFLAGASESFIQVILLI